MSRDIYVGARFYDWQISAKVMVIDASRPHYPRCKTEGTGLEYISRLDALDDTDPTCDSIDLMDSEIGEIVKCTLKNTLDRKELIRSCASVFKTSQSANRLNKTYNNHPLWGVDWKRIINADTSIIIKYLLIHGVNVEQIESGKSAA